MRINAPKTTVMSAFIPGEQRQVVLLDGESLEDADNFKHLGSMARIHPRHGQVNW